MEWLTSMVSHASLHSAQEGNAEEFELDTEQLPNIMTVLECYGEAQSGLSQHQPSKMYITGDISLAFSGIPGINDPSNAKEVQDVVIEELNANDYIKWSEVYDSISGSVGIYGDNWTFSSVTVPRIGDSGELIVNLVFSAEPEGYESE